MNMEHDTKAPDSPAVAGLVERTVRPAPERAALTPATMKRLGYYNWKGQPDRLVYLGRNWSGNGWWHQFRKIGDPRRVWCEVLDADLHMLEETVDTDEPDPDPHEDPAAIFGDPRA